MFKTRAVSLSPKKQGENTFLLEQVDGTKTTHTHAQRLIPYQLADEGPIQPHSDDETSAIEETEQFEDERRRDVAGSSSDWSDDDEATQRNTDSQHEGGLTVIDKRFADDDDPEYLMQHGTSQFWVAVDELQESLIEEFNKNTRYSRRR